MILHVCGGHDCCAAEWLVIIHCMCLNFTLFKIISSILQPISPKYRGEPQSKTCWRMNSRPAVWQQEVGVAVERIRAFPTVTFLQNNCPIMTASSRALRKRVSHFSQLCAVVSGGVKSGRIFFWGKHSAAGVPCYSSQSERSLSWKYRSAAHEENIGDAVWFLHHVSGPFQARIVCC